MKIPYYRKRIYRLRRTAVLSILGAIMFISKIVMEALPNIHMVAMLVTVYTMVYRSRALIAIYVFVFLTGLYSGFNLWWIPYLYIWTILWAVIMLLPRNMEPVVGVPVYTLVCGLHGLLYGVLYAPAQAIMFGFNFEMTVAWIIQGILYDAIHAVGNIVLSVLIYPLYRVISSLERKSKLS